MNQKYTEIMMEMYTPDIWEDIGICEGFDIFTKNSDGKKEIDIEKVKKKIKEIDEISDVDSKAAQSKQLIIALLSFVPVIAGMALITVNPLTSILLSAVSMYMSCFGKKIVKGNKANDFAMLANKLDQAALKINRQSKKIGGKDGEELKEKADKLSKMASELRAKSEKESKK